MHTKAEPSIFTLLLMISFPVVNAVLITPALPAIASFFNVSNQTAQHVVTWYLVGYALGQLIYGPLANRFGRKPALYMGVGLQIASSLFCVLAGVVNEFPLLITGRFTLALGAGVGLKMAFTLVNECYEPKIVSQKVSYLMLAFAITPGLAMALGGYLTDQYGWMSCFYAGAVYGILLLLLLVKLPETKKVLDYDALKIKHLLRSYSEQFKNVQLFSGGLLMGLTTCFVYIFATIAPFVAINLLGMSSQEYGVANIIPSVGYVVFAIATAKLATKYHLESIILAGILIVAVGIALMFLAMLVHLPALVSLFIPITIIYFGEVLIYPNTSALAMSTAVDKAHASAVMNFLTIGLPTIAVLSMGLFSISTLLLPIIFSGLCIAIIVVYKWVTAVR